MAYLKTQTIYGSNAVKSDSFKVRINVSNKGQFYCKLPDILHDAIHSVQSKRTTIRDNNVYASSLEELTDGLTLAFRTYLEPETKKEHVILYNMESHVSFATNGANEIFPNAGLDGAEWQDFDGRYGNHHSSNKSKGGYSLTIGAKAMTKTTYKFGDYEKVEYSYYYKNKSHHSMDNPACLLNSWCSFELPESCKEIRYNDKAATFFYNLMMSMAKISLTIQSQVFEEENLLSLISRGDNLLGVENALSTGSVSIDDKGEQKRWKRST